jgi:transcriptional regulator
MYIPVAYEENRREVLLEAIRARSFGTLITAGARGVQISHIPFGVVEGDGGAVLIGHLARSNPHWREMTRRTQAVASFLVDDCYISPSWYPSKAESGKVVPTWNYVAVEARGEVELVQSGPALAALIEALTARHEQGRAQPWSMGDAPADYTEALMRAIVGVRLRVRGLVGAWKLDQKKRAADRAGAARGVAAERGWEGIGTLML